MEHALWLEERRRGVGGSDIAAIMGLSPFKTAYQVYREKRKEVEDWQGNELTDWGKRLEPAIRQWYSDTTGRSVRLPDKIMYHPKHPFMLASLDGFTDDGRVVEIKTARSGKNWGEPETNQIPDYYAVQVHHYMTITGFQVADIPVSIAGGSPSLYIVEADKEISEMIIEACAKFWERVQSGNPPDPVTYADAVARFGKSSSSGAVIASGNTMIDLEELRSVRQQMKDLAEREEFLKGNIITFIGESGDTLINESGETLLTYKLANGRKLFDSKSLEKEMPEVYQKYLKQSEPARRFLVK
ncbi:MAG: YqaJ-like viral recombinase domain protein [Deltaproteobacteria bacterium ADurb.Bin151]|nr:MAG: YqaJ-like viral recombinase domain protein [Deltaproteobacteria bacterium ADurb.Bin151]